MSHRHRRSNRLHILAAATALALSAPLANAQSDTLKYVDPELPGQAESQSGIERFIVRFRASSAEARNPTALRRSLERAAIGANQMIQADRLMSGGKAKAAKPLGLAHIRRGALGSDVVQASAPLDAAGAAALMRQLRANPSVQSVEPDIRLKADFIPNDPGYEPRQWHYFEAVGGMRAEQAWDVTRGAGQIVAVLDTGITDHSDLNANVLPGYDFITDLDMAQDGNGRDSDAHDPGDFDEGYPEDEGTYASSWHGTHVAGTIAAVTNNANGVAGVAHGARIVPVRVLGRGGGDLSDINDAIVWASGGSVPGVPANPYPAKVINMSLGGGGLCGASTQAAINSAVARGTTVVVSAGNSSADVGFFTPASCANVISVASTTRTAVRSGFSNAGPRIDIAAPGSNIASTLNDGETTVGEESYAIYSGTSMSAPHVAGTVALMQANSPVPRTPAQIELMIKGSVRDVVAIGNLNAAYIGRGILDARAALDQAKPCGSLTGDKLKTCRIICESTATPAQRDLFIKLWNAGAGTTPLPCNRGTAGFFQNGTDFAIPDNNLTGVDSTIAVTGIPGMATRNLAVSVDIAHTYVGDLRLRLRAPGGTIYRLSTRAGSSSNNIPQTYVIDASAEAANGTWTLRVDDNFADDTGTIQHWSLQF